MKVAVVGHAEWVDFLVADRLPRPGEIVHARSVHEAPAGGGGMAAYALRALAGSCAFYCALGDDARGAAAAEGLRAAGIDVRAAVHPRPHRRIVTYLTADTERTITVLGDRLVPLGDDDLPWDELGGFDGVFLTGGDAPAVRAARRARVLVAVPRARDAILEAGVEVDVLVGSLGDPGEVMDDELVAAARPRWIVQTEGDAGGAWRGADGTSGRWAAAPLPGEPVDAYGCGDCFAVALMYGLARGLGIEDACALGAQVGAALLCERAPAVGALAALRPSP